MTIQCKHCDDTQEVYSEDGEGPWMCPWCYSPHQNVNFQSLPPEMIDKLEPYFESKNRQLIKEDQDRRVKKIVALLFPNWDKRQGSTGPTRHPGEKSWWWNGASVEEYQVSKIAVYVELKSYVAGGNYDEHKMCFPSAWLELDDPTETVLNWCKGVADNMALLEKANARAAAIQAIATATEQLNSLDNQ